MSSPAVRKRVATGAGAALLAALTVSAPAHAAFTTGKCLGDPILSRGASFAASANQQLWIPSALPVFCGDVGTTPTVTYDSQGSGSGRRAMGARTNGAPEGDNTTGSKSRNQGVRIGATDEPMTTAVQAEINKGTDAVGDEGLSRLLPVAIGAVAVVLNVPNGCSATTKADGSDATALLAARFSNPTDANKRRITLTRTELERIYFGAGDYDTWGQLLPDINDGNGTPAEAADTRCQNFPLIHVRRLDDSGTTFVFKDYLSQLNPAVGWLTTFIASPDTRNWPNASRTVSFDYNNDGDTADTVPFCAQQGPVSTFNAGAGYSPNAGSPTPCPESGVPLLQTTPDLPSAGNGNDNLVDQVNDMDGSIGYGDLSTARQERSAAFERQANATDDKYWVQVQSKNLSSYADPAAAANGFVPGGTRGSNCADSALRNLPSGDDPTTGNWFDTSATDSSQTGYGICSLTYDIAFDDYSTAYSGQSDQAAEERKARTVKDYLGAILSSSGQAFLAGFDYSPLPVSIQAISRDAIGRIGWAKAGDTGGNPTPPPPPPPPAGNPPAPAPGAPAPPVNQFTIPSARASNGNVVLSVQVPGGGNISATGSTKVGAKTLSAGSFGSSFAAGGAVKVTLKPSAAFKRALARARSRKLVVTVKVTFTPTGGAANTRSVKVTLKAPKKKAAKKKK